MIKMACLQMIRHLFLSYIYFTTTSFVIVTPRLFPHIQPTHMGNS